LNNLIAALAGLVIPGLGHAIKGRWLLGVKFQLLALGGVVLICLSRLIVSPYGLEMLAIFLAVTHISSSLTAIRLPLLIGNQCRQHLISSGFAMASLAMALGLFVSKASLLGMNVYYIPSASMYPTLKPGDLIIVDTWAYRGSAPEVNDIVTFMLPNKPGHVMVKRIARTEDAGVSYIMLGDNPNDSEDSRHFGGVPRASVHGKVVRTVDALKH
ncbi:MAG: nickel-type superoxide dismutase maturation protease, partial [Alcanivoracaceae bacterium]|jgi:signal peptidase I|nr:nickel-type superoxide dismutase maturation protease [Alcanivoracaceae bacterium]